MKAYAGIGSRETPLDICALFTKIAGRMESNGFTLRSGGADGADKAFESGAGNNKLIYLPWKGFNGSTSILCSQEGSAKHNAAMDLASKYHPAWDKLSPAAKKMMARNCYQVLSLDLKSPAKLVICWTPNGSGSGGTGQAIRIANDYNIPVVDFGKNTVEFNLNCIKKIILGE